MDPRGSGVHRRREAALAAIVEPIISEAELYAADAASASSTAAASAAKLVAASTTLIVQTAGVIHVLQNTSTGAG